MNPVTQPPLRKIAEHLLSQAYGDLAPAIKNELATSLVRQWLTQNGHAGLATSSRLCWFRFARKDAGFDGSLQVDPWGAGQFLSEAKIRDEGGLLHRLNLCQSVPCRDAAGQSVRLTLDPQQKHVRCEKETDG